MNSSLMILTGVLRAFDGYDRWERYPYQAFGSLEELQALKVTLDNPLFSNRKYINLEIREATEKEIILYKKELQKQLHQYEKDYQEVLQKKEDLSTLIQESKEKIASLEQLKIPQ